MTARTEAEATAWMTSTPGETALGPTDVHVWRFNTDARITSESALREVLSGYTGTPPKEIEIVRAPRGKPMLAVPLAEIHFNASHSGEWGVVAIARVEVGVDVEQIKPQRASARLTERFMTAGERDLLQRRAESQGDAGFSMIWSRKEAYLKAVGVGLSVPFSTVDSSGERLPDLDEHGHQLTGTTPWAVAEFLVDDRHPATVVARAEQIFLHSFTLRRSDA